MRNGAMLHFLVSFTLFIFKFPILVLSEPKVPCYFIFGDSLVDNGNNNDLQTIAKANYLPYGSDFQQGPTGRFSNGRNIADFIAKDLGFDGYIPPFAIAKDKDIMRGVNYASGGAGIRDETGKHMGEVISLSKQLANHEVAISRITALRGNKQFTTDQHLTKCLYTVVMGSNDYINNYFGPKFYNSSRLFTPSQYAKALIYQYSKQLQRLYKLGARKIGVFGLVEIGCTPAEIAMFGTPGTLSVDKINDAVNLFNDKLKPAIDDLNSKFQDAKFILIGGKAPMTSMSAAKLLSPCCNVSRTGAVGLCIPNRAPCSNRLQHVFFDGFHPTESASFLVAKLAYTAIFSKLL